MSMLSKTFGIEGGMLDVIVLIPDHCLSIYLGFESNLKESVINVFPLFERS